MATLTPRQAAEIADGVYALRQAADLTTAYQMGGGLGLTGQFTIDGGTRLSGRSGAVFYASQSGFGYVAQGIGARQGEVLIALRGTAMLADWVTDANIGLRSGPGGSMVHAGFMETFSSFAPALQQAMASLRPAAIHVVGHSLGGALATLTAASLVHTGHEGVSLYTFGSPRAGVESFARDLSRRLANSIHRVYHVADPVSMVPIFPFHHVPYEDQGIHLPWSGSRISVDAHGMENYIRSVGENSWANLHRAPLGNEARMDPGEWLSAAGATNPIMLSAAGMWMLGRALGWIISEAATVLGGVTLCAAATVIDQLALLLHHAAMLSARIAESLKALIQRIFQFLGRTANTVTDVSTSFLRWVLDLLFQAVATLARRAFTTLRR